jgi:hypothetical protein
MNAWIGKWRVPRLLQAGAGILAAGLAIPDSRAAGAEVISEITSISSEAASGYVRARLPDGTFQEETYAFGEGGHVVGRSAGDAIDKLKFQDLAKILAAPLASRRYVQADEPAHSKLLIMVYWGTTRGTEGASSSPEYQSLQAAQKGPPAPLMPMSSNSGGLGAESAIGKDQAHLDAITGQLADAGFDSALASVSVEDKQRLDIDMRNARLLGYDTDLEESQGLENTVLGGHRDELIKEIEEDRYFVVMMAYDFQKLWKEKQRKLLWVTRISIRQRGNDFQAMLPAMAQYASDYFGRNSHGLMRKEIREGHVEIGEPKSLGVVPDK